MQGCLQAGIVVGSAEAGTRCKVRSGKVEIEDPAPEDLPANGFTFGGACDRAKAGRVVSPHDWHIRRRDGGSFIAV